MSDTSGYVPEKYGINSLKYFHQYTFDTSYQLKSYCHLVTIHLRHIIVTEVKILYVFYDTCIVGRVYSDIGGGEICNYYECVWNHSQLDFERHTHCKGTTGSFMLTHGEKVANLKTNTAMPTCHDHHKYTTGSSYTDY